MENILQALETSIANVEHAVANEAKKVGTEVIHVAQQVEPVCDHIFACVKCHFTKAEILTQAEGETHALDGSFMRLVRRVWEAV